MNIIRFLKDNILGFIVGTILFGGIAVVYATTIASNTVDYENSANSNVATVKDALDDLYSKIMPLPVIACYKGTCGELSYRYWSNNFVGTGAANIFDTTHMPTTTYETRSALVTAYGSSNFNNNPIYIRSILIDGNVVGHQPCLWYNSKEHCMEYKYWVGTISTSDAHAGTSTQIKLQRDMQEAFGITIDDSSCTSGDSTAYCSIGNFIGYSNYSGDSYYYSIATNKNCGVAGDGTASCISF